MNHLPNASFLQSRTARVELARQRFFEEGQAPTGMVGHAVFESWSRCLRLHGNPHERAAFEPVTPSRTQLALMKNQHLRQAWMDESPRLESILNTTPCAAMLTDATGVLIGAACVGRSHEALMPVATRLGVNLSEDAVGTTAPGVVVRTGQPVCVIGGEHFFDSIGDMHCAAAPIRDIHGQLAGVLDISSERIPFAFDAAAVAGLYAGAIENRLLVAQSKEHLVVRFQIAPELLDSTMVGLVGIDRDGRLAWENGVARSLLGSASTPVHPAPQATEDRLGLAWAQLATLPAAGAAPWTLPNGLQVWARAEMRARDGHRGSVVVPRGVGSCDSPHASAPTAAPDAPDKITAKSSANANDPPATAGPETTPRLRDSDLELIQRTLRDCDDNVSETAQRLGVSRGLIYRRLRAAGLLGKSAAP